MGGGRENREGDCSVDSCIFPFIVGIVRTEARSKVGIICRTSDRLRQRKGGGGGRGGAM